MLSSYKGPTLITVVPVVINVLIGEEIIDVNTGDCRGSCLISHLPWVKYGRLNIMILYPNIHTYVYVYVYVGLKSVTMRQNSPFAVPFYLDSIGSIKQLSRVDVLLSNDIIKINWRMTTMEQLHRVHSPIRSLLLYNDVLFIELFSTS